MKKKAGPYTLYIQPSILWQKETRLHTCLLFTRDRDKVQSTPRVTPQHNKFSRKITLKRNPASIEIQACSHHASIWLKYRHARLLGQVHTAREASVTTCKTRSVAWVSRSTEMQWYCRLSLAYGTHWRQEPAGALLQSLLTSRLNPCNMSLKSWF